jgi:hypothetical protein
MDVTTETRGMDSRAGDESGGQRKAGRRRVDPRRHRLFHRPVTVQTGRLDRERVVASTRDAAAVLLKDWPLADSVKRTRAMAACLSVIRGEKPPHVARRAFVTAAREAKVLVED